MGCEFNKSLFIGGNFWKYIMVGFHKSLMCKYLFDYLTDCNQNRLSGYGT